jgi:hypothetical protein
MCATLPMGDSAGECSSDISGLAAMAGYPVVWLAAGEATPKPTGPINCLAIGVLKTAPGVGAMARLAVSGPVVG